MWEISKEGMKTLRNSEEKMPPLFITPLFLILRDTERRGCLKWNSLRRITPRGLTETPESRIFRKGKINLLWWNIFWSAGPISDPVYFSVHQNVVLSFLLCNVFLWLEKYKCKYSWENKNTGANFRNNSISIHNFTIRFDLNTIVIIIDLFVKFPIPNLFCLVMKNSFSTPINQCCNVKVKIDPNWMHFKVWPLIDLLHLPDSLLDWTFPHQMLSVHHHALDLEVCEDCASILGQCNYNK